MTQAVKAKRGLQPIALASAGVATAIAIGAIACLDLPTVLLWNASASVPEGLYGIARGRSLKRGDLVVAWLPDSARKLAAQRHYLPSDVPLIKPIAALPHQTVCRVGTLISIDGVVSAAALIRDSRNRELPTWSGCRTLRAGQIFLMNPAVRDSFDSRYFGPIDQRLMIGNASPLYILQAPQPSPRSSTN